MNNLARRLDRVGVWLSPRSLGVAKAAETRAAAREISSLGYPSLWFAEGLRSKEAFTHASVLLGATERLVVATGIAGIWGRDAVATNAAANVLGEAHPGRFVLGLGVSHKPMTSTRGHDYGKPIAATRAGAKPASPAPTTSASSRSRPAGTSAWTSSVSSPPRSSRCNPSARTSHPGLSSVVGRCHPSGRMTPPRFG